MDLVRAVVDAAGAGMHGHLREGGRVGQAERAVHLDGPVDDLVQDARRVELEQRDFDARLRALVDLPGAVHRQEPARLDSRGRVRDPVLHRLLVGERPPERLPLERVGAHEVERALHLPEPAHDVVDAPRPEALLRQPERLARLAERVRERHAHAL